MNNSEELALLTTSPGMVVDQVINKINSGMENGSVTLAQQTTPFHNLMEMSAQNAVDTISGIEYLLRTKEASLAVTEQDLYHKITTDQLANMFSIPGDATVIFYLNVINLKEHGIQHGDYIETVIPEFTKIDVGNTELTILNDISVKYYTSGAVSAEQLNSDLDIAVNDLGILKANITTTQDGGEWIVLETKVKNITKYDRVVLNMPTNDVSVDIPITNEFSNCYVYFDNGDGDIPLKLTFSQNYIDPKEPTALITIGDGKVNVTIPPVYLLTGQIAGTLKIDIYGSEGDNYLPINQLPASDFRITEGNTTKTKETASFSNIATMVVASSPLTGGKNSMSFEELRTTIIEQTTGDIDLPVSNNQLKRKATMKGYTISKVSDLLTSRAMVAVKNPPKSNSNLLLSEPDIFFNTVKLILDEEKDKSAITLYEDVYTIKAGTVFNYDNGIATVVSDAQLDEISKLSKFNKIAYMKSNKLYYTPYEYVFKYDESITESEVYYFGEPKMDEMRILNKNQNVPQSCNIANWGVVRTAKGYNLMFNLLANKDLEDSDISKLRSRVVMNIADASDIKVYFEGKYDVDKGMFIIEIDTNYIYNNRVSLKNGESSLFDKSIMLSSKATIYTYTVDDAISDNSNFLKSELTNLPVGATVYTKEEIKVILGEKLNYIFNNVYSSYTDRKYKTHKESVPAIYEKDVFQENENGLIVDFNKNSDGEIKGIAKRIHKEGDIKKDGDGNIIYKYTKDQLVLDEQGKPILDKLGGVKRLVDICMLEYEYSLVESEVYNKNTDLTISNLNSMIANDMKDLNNVMLDNTVVRYRSYKTASPLNVRVNNVNYPINHIVRPRVVLYLMDNISLDTNTLIKYKNIACKVINRHFDKSTIVLENIKEDIKKEIGGDVDAVKVTNIDARDSEVIRIVDNNRFTLSKELLISKNNEIIVDYGLDIETVYV